MSALLDDGVPVSPKARSGFSPLGRMVKILERIESGIFQSVASDQIGLLKRKTRLAVICNVS